jgi:hypothetical protein
MLNDDAAVDLDSGDEESSAAPHVDLDKVVGAINDELGAGYSGKYTLGSFVKYNGQKYTPRKREIVGNETRPDGMVFDRSKGHCRELLDGRAGSGEPGGSAATAIPLYWKWHMGPGRCTIYLDPGLRPGFYALYLDSGLCPRFDPGFYTTYLDPGLDPGLDPRPSEQDGD